MLRPLHDRVLLKRIEEETVRRGIIIPDSAKEKPQEGKIVAVGKGKVARTARRPRSTSRRVIACSSRGIPAARSAWTAKSTSS
jgi:co-chaperonin GroES (HSP10)